MFPPVVLICTDFAATEAEPEKDAPCPLLARMTDGLVVVPIVPVRIVLVLAPMKMLPEESKVTSNVPNGDDILPSGLIGARMLAALTELVEAFTETLVPNFAVKSGVMV